PNSTSASPARRRFGPRKKTQTAAMPLRDPLPPALRGERGRGEGGFIGPGTLFMSRRPLFESRAIIGATLSPLTPTPPPPANPGGGGREMVWPAPRRTLFSFFFPPRRPQNKFNPRLRYRNARQPYNFRPVLPPRFAACRFNQDPPNEPSPPAAPRR